MSQVITKRARLSRRFFLKGLTVSRAAVVVGLPPLVSMFNSIGTAYAAEVDPARKQAPFDRRFVLWFNGNGIPERYWIPDRTGADYDITGCLTPIARLRDHVHVLSGLDNSAVGNSAGDGHSTSMSALMTCTHYTGRSPGGPRPAARARGGPAPAVRQAFRGKRGGLDQPQAQHSRRGLSGCGFASQEFT